MIPYYYNIGMYYCSPWQPVFSDGRSLIPLKKISPRVATSDQHHVSYKLTYVKMFNLALCHYGYLLCYIFVVPTIGGQETEPVSFGLCDIIQSYY